jgi:hypothetical protein
MKFMQFQGPTFTMQVPTSWFVTSSPKFQAVFTAPEKTGGAAQANLIVSVRPVKDDVTAVAVAQAAKETQQKEYPEYEVLEEIVAEDAELPTVHRLYKWHNLERQMVMIQRQAFYVHDNRLYTLTATRSETNGEDTEEIDETLLQMMNSFSLEKGR